MLERLLPVFVVGLGLLVPSAASGASVTLNAPDPNAVFYTGESNAASVFFSASRSSADCTISPTAQTFGMYLRLPGDTFSIFAMSISDEGTISSSLPLVPGEYDWKGALTCEPNGGVPDVESGVRHLSVIQGSAPPGGGTQTPEEIDAGIRAACEKQRDANAGLARVNRKRRDLVPAVEYAERLASRTALAAKAGAYASDRLRLPGLGTLFKLEDAILRVQAFDAKYLAETLRKDIAKLDKEIAESLADYNKSCKGYTLAARSTLFSSFGSPTASVSQPPVTDAKAAGTGTLLRNLRRNARQQRKSAKRLKAAISTLTSRLTDQGARTSDIAAVRKWATTAAEAIRQHGQLRAALARNRSLGRIRLRARDLPRGLRRDSYVRQFIDKPISKVFASKSLARAERRLIAVLRQQPILP